jgi:site-specific recombinase XerD
VRAPQIAFDQLVQDFFLRRLINQRGASPRTVESYRDAFELLFGYIEQRLGKQPSALTLADLDAPMIVDFLEHLEAVRDPASLPITTRVLAIPSKRFDRPVLGHLTQEQIAAILAAPDRTTWTGQRDAVLFAVAYNTGARVSELTALKVRDILVDRQAAVHLHGKGRKERVIPLWANTATELRAWLARLHAEPEAPAFPNRNGTALTRSGVRDRLSRAVTTAQRTCPSMEGQRVSPHTIRHSTAVHLLQAGVDLAVIALWLGHSSPAVTYQYLEADLATKEATLSRLHDQSPGPVRFRPPDRLLAFLEQL